MNRKRYLTVSGMIQVLLDDPNTATIILDNKELNINDLLELEENELPIKLYHIDLIEYGEDYISDEDYVMFPRHVETKTYYISTIV